MKRLRTVLRLNAATCLAFGMLFVLAPQSVTDFLGAVPTGLLQIVALLLLLNGTHLAVASVREKAHPLEVLYFSFGDILWFIGSLALVGINVLVTTNVGQVVTMIVGFGVLMLGLAQVWLLADAVGAGVPQPSTPIDQRGDLMPATLSRNQAIVASWMALKMWVKTWLFFLNGLFLGAILFLPEPTARLTLTAYVASGPLLAATMIWQRGLTRLLGIAHLIPWLPFVAYLFLSLTSDTAGPMISWDAEPTLHSYLVYLLVATVICLVLDVYDTWRWWRGERFRFGARSPATARASIP